MGSSSPRRQQLLSQIGLVFDTVKPETEEVMREGEAADQYVQRNACEKADWVMDRQAESSLPVMVLSGTL